MKRGETLGMFYLLILIAFTLLYALASCKSTKYIDCDAYKTHIKSPKATKPHTYKF